MTTTTTTSSSAAVPTQTGDVIDLLAGLGAGSPLDGVRRERAESRSQAQASFDALFTPVDAAGVSLVERFAVAAVVTAWHGAPAAEVAAFYREQLVDAGAATTLVEALDEAVSRGLTSGPYGAFPDGPLSPENVTGPDLRLDEAVRSRLGARLSAAVEHTHLLVFHPRDSSAAALTHLTEAGWSTDDIVTLSQEVAFLGFQVRVVHGLRAISTASGSAAASYTEQPSPSAAPTPSPASAALPSVAEDADHRPVAFTQQELDWQPWLPPLAEDDLTERHYEGLVDRPRAKNAYFRLLARDPEILAARTRTDKDIFYNAKSGLPRAERELSAAAASRSTGCIYCASVHSRFASHFSKRPADVQRLLDEGQTADLGERWNALVESAVALTATPVAFEASHVERLRALGLDDLSIVDAVSGAAFFWWANRLMLSLGEPFVPQG